MTTVPALLRAPLRASRAMPFARMLAVAAFGAAVGALAPAAHAQAQGQAQAQSSVDARSPVGLWRNIDDETKKPKALVRITERDGVYYGRIEKILTERTDGVCELCTDERKDQPMQGMQIIDGMRASSDEPGLYEGGRILDPNNGKVYRSRMRVIDGGEHLEVRGFIGAPLFGRTQTWVRER
ncbi:MAG: DUF2147 domain-containing protein [Burkholderiaceae bacterium]|nr:DUF2147 domain-containing protein [Burkholderiaceae bacterium]